MQITGKKHRASDQAGFSVIEILVSTALTLALMATVFSLNRTQLQALRRQAVQLDIQSTARDVVDLFAREVRRASMDPTCGGAFEGIATAKSHEIRFQSDLNGNGVIDGTNEDITYQFVKHQTIIRTEGDTSDTLLEDIDLHGHLNYFDGDGNNLGSTLDEAERAEVRRISFRLSLEDTRTHPDGSPATEAYVTTDINLRNRFFVSSTACAGA